MIEYISYGIYCFESHNVTGHMHDHVTFSYLQNINNL